MNTNNHNLQVGTRTAPPARIDNVDVAELLRDIGEASASTAPVDLFGMCLRAQRVINEGLAGAAEATPAEAQLLAAYRASTDAARNTVVLMVRSIAEGSPRHRPSLTLVRPAQPLRGGVHD